MSAVETQKSSSVRIFADEGVNKSRCRMNFQEELMFFLHYLPETISSPFGDLPDDSPKTSGPAR